MEFHPSETRRALREYAGVRARAVRALRIVMLGMGASIALATIAVTVALAHPSTLAAIVAAIASGTAAVTLRIALRAADVLR